MSILGKINGVCSTPIGGYIPEMEQTISQLERGTLVTKFFPRKRPESKTLWLRRETRQILWTRPSSAAQRTSFEGAIELREIKEIRLGKNSKDFEKWPDDAKRMENGKCFVIFYGTEFKLRVLSIAGIISPPPLFIQSLRNVDVVFLLKLYPKRNVNYG